MELFKASNQWATRPADERFPTIEALYKATREYAAVAQERNDVPYSSLRTEAQGSEVMLVGKGNVQVRMGNWAFGQLCARVSSPAGFIRELPPTLASQVLNNRLKARETELGSTNLLFHRNGDFILRAITSEKYSRIWNYEVAERVRGVEQLGWKTPPARESNGSTNSGLYASDHDMFIFIVNDQNRIQDGSDGGLGRGLFISNSEVGAAALKVTKFLYRYVCGNHIVWGAKDVQEISIRHIGNATASRMQAAFEATAIQYANESSSDQEAKILNARRMKIGNTKEEVLDYVFGKRMMTRKAADIAYDAALPSIDGDPRTVWGFVNGVTRASQMTSFADERTEMDRAAAKVLAMAF